MSKVFLTKDVQKLGFAGEVVKVKEGYATNYLIPNKLGILVTPSNEASLKKRIKTYENRKEALSTKTSMLAEKIKSLKLVVKKKIHDDEKLYGAVTPSDIVDLLAKEGIKVSKNQILFDKSIKSKGVFDVTIKLSNSLMPTLKLKVQPE
jgi:large subunit ribosomal protein L9